ncbi:Allantoinase [Microbotryomycetes sp. JL201]|nr:Allantoinase [Microbotryomycetes sp. JL201]
MTPRTVFVTSKCFVGDGQPGQPATIVVQNGTIRSIALGRRLAPQDAIDNFDTSTDEYVDVGNKWILPGLVDAHVHLNEPGRTEWEGFATGTAAAASGGVTTVIDMPLNAIPPTTTVANLHEKLAAAKGQCRVDVGFYGGVIPGNENDLVPLAKEGVKGFKCFLIESGVDEFPCVNEQQVLAAMPKLLEAKSVFMFHAELDTSHNDNPSSIPSNTEDAAPEDYSTFLNSRPQSLEIDAIDLISRCAQQYPQLQCHIVHLSASRALPRLKQLRQHLNLTVETCFHYLTLSSEQIKKGQTLFKCCPPIRERSNQDELWRGLLEGEIDFIVSDHSPCTTELKKLEAGHFMQAWGGIGGLGLGLSLIWTEANKRKVGMERIVEWCCTRPAKQVGLQKQKGQIRVGFDADFVVFDADLQFTVNKSELYFKNKASPYEGMTLTGAVDRTYLRGQKIFSRKEGFRGSEPSGKLLL